MSVTAAPQMTAAPQETRTPIFPRPARFGVAAVRTKAPHDRGDNQRQHGEDQADRHDRADDVAQLRDTGQAGVVGVDVHLRRQQDRGGENSGDEIEHEGAPDTNKAHEVVGCE